MMSSQHKRSPIPINKTSKPAPDKVFCFYSSKINDTIVFILVVCCILSKVKQHAAWNYYDVKYFSQGRKPG